MAREMSIAIGFAALALATGCTGSTYQIVPTGHGTFMIPSQVYSAKNLSARPERVRRREYVMIGTC